MSDNQARLSFIIRTSMSEWVSEARGRGYTRLASMIDHQSNLSLEDSRLTLITLSASILQYIIRSFNSTVNKKRKKKKKKGRMILNFTSFSPVKY